MDSFTTYIPFDGNDHYLAADQALREQHPPGSERERNCLLRAQVHATLAAAAVQMDIAYTVEEHGPEGKRVFMAPTREGAGYGR